MMDIKASQAQIVHGYILVKTLSWLKILYLKQTKQFLLLNLFNENNFIIFYKTFLSLKF
jgi:hypothetical protein